MQPLTTAQVKIPKDGQDFQIILLDPLFSVEFLEHQSLVWKPSSTALSASITGRCSKQGWFMTAVEIEVCMHSTAS